MKVANLWGKIGVLSAVTLGALLILVYYYGAAGGRLPTAEDRYTVSATVDEPQQLLKHADVRAAGVKVGEVVGITGRGRRAQVELDLEKDIAPVYNDATVLVRQKTLVGENYVEIVRGTPRAGVVADGATLPHAANQEAVPVDRILNSLDTETRKNVSTHLQALGGGFKNRGTDVNALAAALQPLATDGSQVTAVLNAQSRQVADIIEHGNTVFAAVADRRRDLTSLLRAARTTAVAVAARVADLQRGFSEFPATLKQARSSVGRLAAFSGRAVPVVSDLSSSVRDLTPVIRDLQPTAVAANKLFDELPKFTKQADPLLSRLKAFSKVAGPALPALDALLRQANPALEYIKPYNKDLTHFLSVFGGNEFYDKYGGIGRCSCPVGDRSFANWTPAMKQAADVLLEQGVISKVQKTANNHFRAAGSAPRGDIPFTGDYPRIEAGK
jgi:phospholipid/cholesterol/gamma-HCH transport system substrate-binding protein